MNTYIVRIERELEVKAKNRAELEEILNASDESEFVVDENIEVSEK